jgi:hypothetical protein
LKKLSAFVRSIVVCQMAALSFVIASVFLLILGPSGLNWIAGIVFLVAGTYFIIVIGVKGLSGQLADLKMTL